MSWVSETNPSRNPAAHRLYVGKPHLLPCRPGQRRTADLVRHQEPGRARALCADYPGAAGHMGRERCPVHRGRNGGGHRAQRGGIPPAERWGEAADLGGPAVFLASDASNFVNGHILYVDGPLVETSLL